MIYSAGTHPDSENQDVDDRSIINCGRTLFARLNKYDSGELGEVPPLYPKNINRQFLIRVSRLALVDINNHRRVLVMIGDGDNITWEHLLGSAAPHTFLSS